MRKEKKKKAIEFDPADYEYMDTMRLEGWIWEFIRRSHPYKTLYSKIHHFVSIERGGQPLDYSIDRESYSDFVAGMKKIGLAPYYQKTLCVCDKCREKITYFQNTPTKSPLIMDHHLIFCIDKSHDFWPSYGIPDPAIRFSIFHSHPKILGLSYLECKTFDALKRIPDWVLPSPLSVLTFLSPSGIPEDTIYVGIKKSARISDIEKSLVPTIKKHLSPKRSKKRDEKWKYYLIVHDLVKAEMLYSEISEELIKFYLEDKNLLDVRNIENYYKNSLVLIDGGYKKYL